MSLGNYIREKRKEKDWSQRDLSAASGISNAEISRLEAGKRKEPSPTVLKAIAKALNTPVDQILQEAGIIEEGKSTVNRVLEHVGSTPVSAITQSSYSSSSSYISVEDLSEEEIADVKQYISFLKSKRK